MATTTAWLLLRAATTTDGYYYKWLPYRISRGARSRRATFLLYFEWGPNSDPREIRYRMADRLRAPREIRYRMATTTGSCYYYPATTTTATTIEDGGKAITGAETSRRNRTKWAREPRHPQQIYRQNSRRGKRAREPRHSTQITRNGHVSWDIPKKL